MFPTPWHQETVEILKRHPDVSVGIHLTLNSEWKNYRWGPVLGRTRGPDAGRQRGILLRFRPPRSTRTAPIRKRSRRELRAQIDRALRSGSQDRLRRLPHGHRVSISGVPRRHGAARARVRSGHVGVFRGAGHDPQYRAAPRHKIDSLVAMVGRLQPRFNMVVTHVGIDDAELGALLDMNTCGALAGDEQESSGRARCAHVVAIPRGPRRPATSGS